MYSIKIIYGVFEYRVECVEIELYVFFMYVFALFTDGGDRGALISQMLAKLLLTSFPGPSFGQEPLSIRRAFARF